MSLENLKGLGRIVGQDDRTPESGVLIAAQTLGQCVAACERPFGVVGFALEKAQSHSSIAGIYLRHGNSQSWQLLFMRSVADRTQ